MSRALATVERRPLDAYYTPDDLAHFLVGLLPLDAGPIVEPSVGGGAFVRAIRAHAHLPTYVIGFDVDEDAAGLALCNAGVAMDYLDWLGDVEWTVGNPPYRHAEAHARHALTTSRNVAFLLRLGFLESAKRYPFWQEHPARKVWVLAERPSFTGGGTDSAAYGFFWWQRGWQRETELEVVSWKG